ncbi:MAG: photosynthetic reaction center subunit H [Hyphomicrobiaceae bacterium]|nr:photosynthetic reaction center subunit H [Hyphomicrobiaceae bacterium]
MNYGITSHIDVAQIVLYAFWLFFFGLILYLRREDRREGYPMETEVSGKVHWDSAIWTPKPKFWKLPDGTMLQAPRAENIEPPLHGRRISRLDGAPYEPTGNPLTEAFGPASYALRMDVPDKTGYGDDKIVPLRILSDMKVIDGDADPRGMPVVSGDGVEVGKVSDLWVDRSESLVRYYEIELASAGAARVLVPMQLATVVTWQLFDKIDRPYLRIRSLKSAQFDSVPRTKSTIRVTRLEEDMISAYYAGGEFFNVRAQPAGSL